MFTDEVTEKLGFYVYRLIDPRNGETFYVGKGYGNRVFAHQKGALAASDDEQTEKLRKSAKSAGTDSRWHTSSTGTASTKQPPLNSKLPSSMPTPKPTTSRAAALPVNAA